MTTLKPSHHPSEHPTDVNKMIEPLSLTERAVFGVDARKCGQTGRVFEQGSGALPEAEQTKMFLRQAELDKRKAEAAREEAERQAAAIAPAAAPMPGLRLVKAPAR
jgi:transposase